MRDYKKEYANYHSRPEQKRNRAARNLWNRRLRGKVPAGKEIDHKRPLGNGGSNNRNNIRYRGVSANRADKSAVKTAMWLAFEDEMMKIANSSDLTEMEKEAILKNLKRGYKRVAKGADRLYDKAGEGYLRGLGAVGLDPMEAHSIAEGMNHAFLHGGAGAALKSGIVGFSTKKAKQKKNIFASLLGKGINATAGEGFAVGPTLGKLDESVNLSTYGNRISNEWLADKAIDLVSSAFS